MTELREAHGSGRVAAADNLGGTSADGVRRRREAGWRVEAGHILGETSDLVSVLAG